MRSVSLLRKNSETLDSPENPTENDLSPTALGETHYEKQRVIDYAIQLWRLGIQVIPAPKKSKHPNIKGYQRIRYISEHELRTAFQAVKDPNICILTGRVSGLLVIDLDTDDAWSKLYEQFPDLPDTWTTKTARGYHLYFRTGDDFRNTVKSIGDFDTRGNGGLVIGAFSEHATTRHIYINVEERGPEALADLPETVAQALRQGRQATSSSSSQPPGGALDFQGDVHSPIHHPEAYSSLLLRELTTRLARMAPRSGRNNVLYGAARDLYTFIELGYLEEAQVVSALLSAVPNSRHDCRATIQSAFKQGANPSLVRRIEAGYESTEETLQQLMDGWHASGQRHAQRKQEQAQKEQENQEQAALSKVRQIDVVQAFAERPSEMDQVLPGLLTGTVGSLVAPGGTGKSFYALQMAIAVADGGAWGSDLLELFTENARRAGGDPVLYYGVEDPDIVIRHRLHAMGQHIPQSRWETIGKNLKILDKRGEQLNICAPDGRDLAELEYHAQGTRLVILDTLSRMHHLDENKNGDMAFLLSCLERVATRTGAAVVFIHHTNKAAHRSRETDQQYASRGASVLIDNVRWSGVLKTMPEQKTQSANVYWARADGGREAITSDNYRQYCSFQMTKQNYALLEGERWYRRGEGGVLLPCNIVFEEKDKNEKEERDRQKGRGKV